MAQLIIRGRVLSRNGQPRFREANFEFLEALYDADDGVQRLPEMLRVPMGNDGVFKFTLDPGTGDEGWIAKLVLIDYDGRAHVDRRILPASGDVDYFTCAKAVSSDEIVYPEGETPLLVSDFNKPGGPLQLTNQGTIADEHIPGSFLRVDDERLPELLLANYVTQEEYDADQLAQKSLKVEFVNPLLSWEYDHGKPYHPLIECIQTDGTVLIGAVSYPLGTTKVRVDWDAPTSGTLIVR